MTSAECKAKIDEFTMLKGKYSALLGYIDTGNSSVMKCKNYLDNIVICGETIDKGLLGDSVNGILMDISSTTSELIFQCDKKISDYERLYKKALRREEKSGKGKGGWFNWT